MVEQNISLQTGPFQLFFLGLQEILSPEDFGKLVSSTSDTDLVYEGISAAQLKPVRQKMNEVYGEKGARGLAMCSGRAAFKHLLSQHGKALGFEANGFRFLPTRLKLKKGLELLAVWVKTSYGDEAKIISSEKTWLFDVCHCHECSGFSGVDAMCDFTAGILQEFLAWAGGEKFYRVQETNCCARGDAACRFTIDKFPLD